MVCSRIRVEKGPKLLARAEYGYQFNPYSYRAPFAAAAQALQVQVVTAEISDVECGEGTISALHLSDGQVLAADLFVDCTGPDARLLSRLGVEAPVGRRLRAAFSQRPAERIGPPCRSVIARDFGWQSETSLKASVARLTVYAPETESEALAAHGDPPQHTGEITLGRRASAWVGNCVAIGHAAAVLEPLTPRTDAAARAGNRPAADSRAVLARHVGGAPRVQSAERRGLHSRADLQSRAVRNAARKAQTSFWLAARAEPPHEKLVQKITQFESRGLLVAFDLEPFTAEDWVILHHGMRRRPARYDRMADRAPEEEVRPMLDVDAARNREPGENDADSPRLHGQPGAVPQAEQEMSSCKRA